MKEKQNGILCMEREYHTTKQNSLKTTGNRQSIFFSSIFLQFVFVTPIFYHFEYCVIFLFQLKFQYFWNRIDWPYIVDQNQRLRLLNKRLESVWTRLFSILSKFFLVIVVVVCPCTAHSYYHWSNIVCVCMCLCGSLFDFLQNAFRFHVISIVLREYVGVLIFVFFSSLLTQTIFDFVRMSKWFILLLFLTMCLINYWIFSLHFNSHLYFTFILIILLISMTKE